MSRIAKVMRLSGAEKRLAFQAAFWLTAAQLAIRLLPFRWIARRLGRHMAESPPSATPQAMAQAQLVAEALDRINRHAPWRFQCLAQAIAGKMMLRRLGIATTLYLGVAKEGPERLGAHAWLRCGPLILTGAAGHDRYRVVGTFAELGTKEPASS
jgi:hypothetical protein